MLALVFNVCDVIAWKQYGIIPSHLSHITSFYNTTNLRNATFNTFIYKYYVNLYIKKLYKKVLVCV